MAKVKLAEKISDIDSSDTENNKQNRQKRAKKMVHSDDEYEDSRCMLPPPPKKSASFPIKKSSEYFLKSPSRERSTLSNEASRRQKENCNSVEVSLLSSPLNATRKITSFDDTTEREFTRKISKGPIELRTLNVDNCNSTISTDMGMYKTPHH